MDNKKFKPMLFSTEMVQAIIDGRKTQTRRLVKPQPKDGFTPSIFKGNDMRLHLESRKSATELEMHDWKLLQPGVIIWVRETFMIGPNYAQWGGEKYNYKASVSNQFINEWPGSWKPSIHMPKEACRIFLKVKSVRVERLNDISNSDAIAEGIEIIHNAEPTVNVFQRYDLKEKLGTTNPIYSYQTLWQKINGINSWNINPWVWAIDFERIEKPENFLL